MILAFRVFLPPHCLRYCQQMPDYSAVHPDLEELRAFVSGRLGDYLSFYIERHLQDCASCTNLLEFVVDDDRLVQLVREAEDAPASQSAPEHVASGREDSQDKGNKTQKREPDVTLGAESLVHQSVSNRSLPNKLSHIGDYELLEELGRGGMGVVYRARHKHLKREVALKVILSGAHSSSTECQRFIREAETIAKLQHSGVVQIFEVGTHDGHPFLVLELVDGGTLSDYVRPEGTDIRWAATMLLQVTRALQAAHQQSIIHRDLKPGNILLQSISSIDDDPKSDESLWAPNIIDRTGEAIQPVPTAKITDFGLAKQTDSENQLTQTGLVVGTPAYMAPEQASGDGANAGTPADIYALGAILYELLTGQPPFQADDALSTLVAVMEDDPVSPREHRPELPRDLETICLKCLMKKPEDRYVSAADLASDLTLFLMGEPVRARRLGVVGRLFRWSRQRPLLAVTYVSCVGFYSLHLVAMYVLKLPLHQGVLHWILTGVFVAWAGSGTLIEYITTRYPNSRLGPFCYVTLTLVCATIVFSADSGLKSAPLPIYILSILGSALIVPRPSMTWYATLNSVLAYSWLVYFSFVHAPETRIPAETTIAFYLSLIIVGAMMHLLLRRTLLKANKSINEGSRVGISGSSK